MNQEVRINNSEDPGPDDPYPSMVSQILFIGRIPEPTAVYKKKLGVNGDEPKWYPVNNLEAAFQEMPPGTGVRIFDSFSPHKEPSRESVYLGITTLPDETGREEKYVVLMDHWGDGEIRCIKQGAFEAIWDRAEPLRIETTKEYNTYASEQWQLVQELITQSGPLKLHPIGRDKPEWCGPATLVYANKVLNSEKPDISQSDWPKDCLDHLTNSKPEKMVAVMNEHGFDAKMLQINSPQELEDFLNQPDACMIVNWCDGEDIALDGHHSVALKIVRFAGQELLMLSDPNLGGEIRFIPLNHFFANFHDQYEDTKEIISHITVFIKKRE